MSKIDYKSLFSTEGLPTFSENVVLDYESIPILPEPDEVVALKEMNKDAIVERMVSELTEGNWVYLEFEDALRMSIPQREHLLFGTACVLDSFIGQSINDDTIKNIRDNIYCAFEEIATNEEEPGVFDNKVSAACAHKRLQNSQKEDS